jgi:hypothetical protein
MASGMPAPEELAAILTVVGRHVSFFLPTGSRTSPLFCYEWPPIVVNVVSCKLPHRVNSFILVMPWPNFELLTFDRTWSSWLWGIGEDSIINGCVYIVHILVGMKVHLFIQMRVLSSKIERYYLEFDSNWAISSNILPKVLSKYMFFRFWVKNRSKQKMLVWAWPGSIVKMEVNWSKLPPKTNLYSHPMVIFTSPETNEENIDMEILGTTWLQMGLLWLHSWVAVAGCRISHLH